MKPYHVVWTILLTFIGYKAVMSILGYDTFFGGMANFSYNDEQQDVKTTLVKSKSSYLVLIGSDMNKYCFLYQPESVIYSFGGARRTIFEQTLIGLHIHYIITVVYTDAMRYRVLDDIRTKNHTDRWHVVQVNPIKRNDNFRQAVRSLMTIVDRINTPPIPAPSTIIFDIGDFSAEYLKAIIQMYRQSCFQYIIFNRKKAMTNIKSITMMMSRAGYRQVQKTDSQYIATFVSKSSPMWK